MSYQRTSRARRQPLAARLASNSQGSLEYTPVLPGLVACAKCAAVVVATEAAKTAHGRFHNGLRALWERGR